MDTGGVDSIAKIVGARVVGARTARPRFAGARIPNVVVVRAGWLGLLDRARNRLFNAQARRPWVAAATGAAIFTPLFWLSVASGVGRLTLPHGELLGVYPAAVVGLYFAAVVVIGPLLAHTAGYVLDHATAKWRRDDAVFAFVGLGAVLGIAAVAFIMVFAPSNEAFAPALWMFGLPLLVTLGLTRYLIDRVLESRTWTRVVLAAGYAPSLLAALVVLGLYVGHATIPA